MKKFLCKIGLHSWASVTTGSIFNPCADKCKRCKIVRQFTMFGDAIYGWDIYDLPPYIKPPTEKDTIL